MQGAAIEVIVPKEEGVGETIGFYSVVLKKGQC